MVGSIRQLAVLENSESQVAIVSSHNLPTLLADVRAEGKAAPSKTCTWEATPTFRTGSLSVLLNDLREPDWQVRMHAAAALGKTKNAEVLHALEECAWLDHHEEVRRIAAKALGEIGSASGCAGAVEALGRIGGTDAAEALLQLSKNPDAGVRAAVALALGDARVADVEGVLKGLLKDEDITVGTAAAKSFAKLGNNYALLSSVAQLKSSCWQMRHHAAAILEHVGTVEVVPALLQALQDPMWKVRVHVALALGKIGHSDAVPSLRTSLQDDDIYVKVAAAKALSCFGILDGVSTLMDSLQHSNEEEIRREAVAVIGEIGGAAVKPVLRGALADQHHEVRVAAAKALAKLGYFDGVSVLAADLKQGDYIARRDAAAALGAIGSSDTVPILLEGLCDRHHHVRRECAAALGVMGDVMAIPLLEESRFDTDGQVRAAANAALAKIQQRGGCYIEHAN